MKLLLFVTGRGIGGDAVIAHTISEALNERNISTKIVLDSKAQGYYYKNKNISWLKSSIPAAGGHASTKLNLFKAGLKTIKAIIQASLLIKSEKADGVVGIIGGGVVVGCLAAKLSGVPVVGVVSTPNDTKISIKCNPTILLSESPLFNSKNNISKYPSIDNYIPIKTDIVNGDKENILDILPDNYNSTKKSVLFSSGSTLFEDMAKAVRKYAEESDNINIFLIGEPLNDVVRDIVDYPNIMNLGYINYIKHLYDLIDLAVITDDGATLHETIACKIPVVVVVGVKYGRYHGLSKVFDGAVIESNVDNITSVVNDALSNELEMKKATKKYSSNIIHGTDTLVDFILENL